MTELAAARRAAATMMMVAVLVSLFVALGFVAHDAAAGTTLDHAVLAWMVNQRHPGLTSLAIAVTNAGSPVGVAVIAVVAAAVSWRRVGSVRPAILILTTLGVAGTISTLTKMIVGAHRPAQAVQLVVETDPVVSVGARHRHPGPSRRAGRRDLPPQRAGGVRGGDRAGRSGHRGRRRSPASILGCTG